MQGLWLQRGRTLRVALLAVVAMTATSAVRISGAPDYGKPPAEVRGIGDLSPVIDLEVRWLLSSIHPSGALALTPDKQRVIPYFSNIAMMAIAGRMPPVAGNYIDWYLDNINMPDRWGVFGTIYDYRVHGDNLTPTLNYDSADSYAATFLTLVKEYYDSTGDLEFVSRRKGEIDVVAGVILALQDKDGLVRVKPRDSTKYLMDNCEDFKGLMDWAFLLDALGDKEAAARYRARAARIAAAVEYRMWDEKQGAYAWRIDRANFPSKPAWTRWYPDAVSQLYPVMNGLISPSSMRAGMLYDKFNKAFPYWPDVEIRHGFPWGMVAQSAIILEDYARALEFVRSAAAKFVVNGGPQPWYCLESGIFILVCDHMVEWSKGLPPEQ
ncbi:MAG: hypothetical protein ACM3X4_13410 [Ignavibacteriales bacterium]